MKSCTYLKHHKKESTTLIEVLCLSLCSCLYGCMYVCLYVLPWPCILVCVCGHDLRNAGAEQDLLGPDFGGSGSGLQCCRRSELKTPGVSRHQDTSLMGKDRATHYLTYSWHSG
ncbi:hypothetical protein Q7C36_000778 [Tachysurus vachellii]|uniref:Uncharacterized protein n=1 Tax=Tachysurus vachellii TaxID=175792 RepID=A0AA88T8H0_TACVA|nr:hypothetical protein Q7C36_000778 [Tachysurus vachellii]